ncbi:MAG: hypothetical protein HC875_01880 [Anaerolineales bacterium]|nr:hypothetical protein [Anaerolineales bacterium]
MELLTNNPGLIFLILGVLWIIQFGLAYWQMRRFYQRMITLRRSGLTAIGLIQTWNCLIEFSMAVTAILSIKALLRRFTREQAQSIHCSTVLAIAKPSTGP